MLQYGGDRQGMGRPNLPQATRANFYGINYSEGGATNRFASYSTSLRNNLFSVIFGSVYKTNTTEQGGVLPGDTGILPTMNTQTAFVGIIRASFRPNGYPKSTTTATMLSQKAGSPFAWPGDTPLDLMPAATRNAPWKANVYGGNKNRTFSSGTSKAPHSAAWGTD